MIETLRQIKKQEEEQGAALATKINVYKDRTTLYRSLQKLEQINTIKKQKAPKKRPEHKTFTTTQFGKKLIQNTSKNKKQTKTKK